MTAAYLMLSMLFGTIGFGFVIYAKNAGKILPAIAGIVLMVLPYFIPNVALMSVVCIGLTGAPVHIPRTVILVSSAERSSNIDDIQGPPFMTQNRADNRWRLPLLFCLIVAAFALPARAWGPHPEITQAALNALGPDDALVLRLGPALGKMPVYCWMADERQTLIIHSDETFYADDYLLFPGVTRYIDLLPDHSK